MSTGYRVTGTVTFEVPVDLLIWARDSDNVVDAAIQNIVDDGRMYIFDRLLQAYVHDDLDFEPYDLDGPDKD